MGFLFIHKTASTSSSWTGALVAAGSLQADLALLPTNISDNGPIPNIMGKGLTIPCDIKGSHFLSPAILKRSWWLGFQ
jgi:hypothetical protein